MFFGGLVVCPGGVDFCSERAEVDFSPVYLDSRFPLSLGFVPFEALVLRAGISFSPGTVAYILRDGGGAEVGFPIVEPDAIDVVADHILGNINNLAMHPDFSSLLIESPSPASSIRAGWTSGQVPVEFAQMFVVLRIDDCVLAPSQRNPPERIAVMQAAIQQNYRNRRVFEPIRDIYNDLNLTAPPL